MPNSQSRGVLRIYGILLFLFCKYLFLPGFVFGQDTYIPEISEPLTETWRWKSIENLSTRGVRTMADDKDGNMWFGLNKGIARYDGYHWTYYDQQSYLQAPVNSLKLIKNEYLIAGSDKGILKLEDNQWVKIFPSNDSIHISVSCILDSPLGLFAGIQNGIVLFTEEKTLVFTILGRENFFRQAHPGATIIILPDEVLLQRNFGRVDDIFIDPDLKVWMFMSRNNEGKLLKFHLSDTLNRVLNKFSVTDRLDGIPLSNRSRMVSTQNRSSFIINGFYKSGILKKTEDKWEQIKLSEHFGGDELHTDIMETHDGSLWIGGLGKLYVLKNNHWNVYSAPALPVPSSRIIFHQNKNGQIWIAGLQGDVFYIDYSNQQWIKYYGLNFQLQDEQGKDWYLSKAGEVVFNESGRWFSYGKNHGLIDDPVRIIKTSKGTLWVAGSHRGVAASGRLKNNRWERYTHPTLSWGIDPRSVFQDKQGNLWFGASVDRQEALGQISGVLQLKNPDDDSLQWVHHTQREGIGQHNVYGIGQSPDGNLWLGGTNLLRYANNRWETMSGIDHLNEFVDIVHSRNNLWVGSRYYGIFRFDGQSWKQYTKTDGLPSNTIISVFEENPESVWVITDKDISWFDGNSWSEGLFPDEFRIPREGGEITVSADGNIRINKALREWKRRAFPFSKIHKETLDQFWTVQYKRGNKAPHTRITVFTEKVDPAGNTFIAWQGNDYFEETPGNHLTFSYRINNKEWSPFSSQTSTVLTNLNSGKYSFEVRARDLDGNVEPAPVKISFVVSPPIWKQSWFIFLVVSFLIIIGYYEISLIKRNRSLFKLNESLTDTNLVLEKRQRKIEQQKEKILQQKEELEIKNNILEEKNVEIIQQRDQLEEMVTQIEELSNIKQRFFTNISHEFRTPLTLILGSIEQLLKSQKKKDTGRLNHTYETIQRNSRRILRLINQILDIRKIETARLELNLENGNIILFAKDITYLFNDLAKQQCINYKFISEDASLFTLFDHDKLEKILFNLLSNAFKSTPQGESITVLVRLKRGELNDAVEFVVEDTGKGISEEYLPKIFDRFYQVPDLENKKRTPGSGIGLSYVKDLLTIHNGHIHVSSTPGSGTCFTFEIPAIYPPGYHSTIDDLQKNNHSGSLSDEVRLDIEILNSALDQTADTHIMNQQVMETLSRSDRLLILIVEDEAELRQFIRGILESEFDIIEAADGQAGYDYALSYQPDMIITDVMMPGLNGFEMCTKLKANIITNHIPLIILTAQTSPENKFQGYETGADAYIEKPFNSDFLTLRIHNLIQSKEKTRDKVMRDLITQPGDVAIHSEDEKMLGKIKDLLEQNISNPDFDVESLSQEFHLSRFHFSRKIKQITGQSPKDIITSFRLKRACQILLQNKMNISEIAYMVGFDHPNSFTRAFRKYYNMTPSEFAAQEQ
jgi:signal transduction histidine kinase/DNA-binding response OmpR family regulator/ligand-binding sensor domain-containing protein